MSPALRGSTASSRMEEERAALARLQDAIDLRFAETVRGVECAEPEVRAARWEEANGAWSRESRALTREWLAFWRRWGVIRQGGAS